MNLMLVIALIGLASYVLAHRQALATAGDSLANLHSRPGHYAGFAFLLAAGPALALIVLWTIFQPMVFEWALESRIPPEIRERGDSFVNFYMADVQRVIDGIAPSSELTPEMQAVADYYLWMQGISTTIIAVLAVLLALFLAWTAIGKISPGFRARNHVEHWVRVALLAAAAVSILTTAGIVFSVLFESLRFFQKVPIQDFLFGLHWSPQTALRADQVGASEGSFGAVPLFAGTLLITVIAMLVAGPIGMFSAIYLSEYAPSRFRATVKPIMEILAGVPTVVYGFFAALTVAPFIRDVGQTLGLSVASESALAAGSVMGIMIIPFVSSLADDAISAVPQAMRDASYALGATRAETVRQVIIPSALPGIIAGFLLAISRAIGETMIVVMAAGLAANLTANPLEAVTTVTVQIVTLLTGDQEFDSAKTLAAFALGLVLFLVTLMLNVIALHIMQTYREKYD